MRGVALLLVTLVGACIEAPPQPQADGHDRRCVRPEEGCSCIDGQQQPCFPDEQDDPDLCVEGTRYCLDGIWSACTDLQTYAADTAGSTHALIDDQRDEDGGVPNCDTCNVRCFKATDDLDPADGPLDGSNSTGGLIYADPMGITLESGEDGLPPGTSPPSVSGNNPPIIATLLPGEQVTTLLDSLPVSLNKVDVYFLIDLEDSMSQELAALTAELTSATDYVGANTCVDRDGDGSPDAHGTGLIEGVRCVARDPWFGAGYFREIPFSPHAGAGQVAFSHVQDMDADGVLTESALSGLGTEDLTSFGDVATSQIVALEALATQDGFDVGPGNPSLAARTDCPSGTRGYPCFRDDAVALVVVLTDRPLHNGPTAGYDYAASLQAPIPPSTSVDLTAQSGAGTFVDPKDLGDVTTTWTEYLGTTSAATLPASVVSCDADGTSGDIVHELTISGLAAGATTPITLSTEGSSFDTVVSLHDDLPIILTSVTVPIANNSLTDTEVQGFELPAAGTEIGGYDLSLSGANSSGLGNEVGSNLMGCLGNDSSAPDAVYQFEVGASGADLTIDTVGSSFDTVIALFRDHVEPVATSWTGWVPYDEFFEEGWNDWNRNGDGVLCTGGSCNQDWACASGSPNGWCGFYLTGSNPRLDDVDCLNGSTCVFVINAPGQTVRLDNVNVRGDSTFYVQVIAAGSVEFDSMYCEDNTKCGFDFGPTAPSHDDTDINCEGNSFCYMVHNNGEIGEFDVNDDATLQIECGSNSDCGKGSSDCDDDSLCVLRRDPSTIDVGLDCSSNAACICLEGEAGDTGCRSFCENNSPAVCANPEGQDVLNNGGNVVAGSVQRVACDDDGAADGVRSSISTGPLDPGTYYIVVKGKGSGESGAYNLRIRDAEDDARLTCNDDASGSVTHSEISQYDLGNGTYYAVVKGGGAGEQGDYRLLVGDEPTPFSYTPPTYADALSALNAEDVRVASVVSCSGSGADCTAARSDADALATASRAEVDPGTGMQPLSYVGQADGSDLGTQVMAGINDLAQHYALDVTWQVVDQSTDPSLDPNPFTTTIAPDDATLCDGVSGTTYLRCQAGEMPSFAITFENPPVPGNVPDNPSRADGAYAFVLQMVGNTPGVAGGPTYLLEEVPVLLVPNGDLDPQVPEDGTYLQTLEARACPDDLRPDWQGLYMKAHVPDGTSIWVGACAAGTEAQLAGCSVNAVVIVGAMGLCSGGCSSSTVCADTLPNITPNDVCIHFSSSVTCTMDPECPAGLQCQNGICVGTDGSPDIATVFPTSELGLPWTRYAIDLRANSARTAAPTLDYWDVTYTCEIPD